LRSVAVQELPPDQVIVVDDAGAGDAGRVVAEVCEGGFPPVVVVEGPGQGPGAARNAGLRAAGGELVAFLDDDDLWQPAKLARQAQWLTGRPSLDVLGTGCLSVEDGLSPTRSRWPAAKGDVGRVCPISLAGMVRANRLVTSSVVARRELVEECGGFDESLPLAQDWDLWLRLAERTEVAVLEAPLVCYRRHGEQRSGATSAMRFWEGEVLRRALARGLPRRLEGVARRRLAWAHVRLGRMLARAAETEAAREEFREAMALWRCNPVAWAGTMGCALAASALARART